MLQPLHAVAVVIAVVIYLAVVHVHVHVCLACLLDLVVYINRFWLCTVTKNDVNVDVDVNVDRT